eukprot:CCRYP_002350-RB/>CCRYP_002350-RB protein AED:0.23 eAED:0.23 QI:52/1/1/1/0.5/0.66/3/43/566
MRTNGITMKSSPAFYSQGLETYQVPMTLYAENRHKVLTSLLQSTAPQTTRTRGIVLLQGGTQPTRYDTDHEPVFRQESYFHYCFGVHLPDCYGALSFDTDGDGGGTTSYETTLFVPTWDEEVATVCGEPPDLEEVRREWGVDSVRSVDGLAAWVEEEMRRRGWKEKKQEGLGNGGEDQPKLFLLRGLNSDSGNYAQPAHYEGIEMWDDARDEETLFRCLAECRVKKTPAEISLLRYTNYVSSMAHVSVMRECHPGMMEYQLESLFMHHTYYYGGCRLMSYTCICACGPNAKILHYGHAGRPNSRLLLPNDMALLDMGAEYHCYASDITCSFPVSGSFTTDQRSIYEAVLNAQIAVIQRLKPGVGWVDMHRVAEREILRGLLACGVLVTGGEEEDVDKVIDTMLDVDLGAIFMPHGLGHFIGIDTHDVGGYLEGHPPRSSRPGLKKLRTARIMEEGMVITVEPGCYFINRLLDGAMQNEKQGRFINVERLRDFRGFGGVRLEDNVVITADGCENLTQCPRSPEEVLDVMNGGQWPPKVDVLPELKRRWAVCKDGAMEMMDVELMHKA